MGVIKEVAERLIELLWNSNSVDEWKPSKERDCICIVHEIWSLPQISIPFNSSTKIIEELFSKLRTYDRKFVPFKAVLYMESDNKKQKKRKTGGQVRILLLLSRGRFSCTLVGVLVLLLRLQRNRRKES